MAVEGLSELRFFVKVAFGLGWYFSSSYDVLLLLKEKTRRPPVPRLLCPLHGVV